MSKIFNNLIHFIKSSSSTKSTSDKFLAFSDEELNDLTEQNTKKIDYLKKNSIGLKEKEDNFTISLKKIEDNQDDLKITKTNSKEVLFDDDELNEEEKQKLDKFYKEINNDDNVNLCEFEESNLKENDPIKEEENTKQEKHTENEKKLVKKGEEVASDKKELKKVSSKQVSYINLSKENMDIIMEKWSLINEGEIAKDIIEGKDIINHNYNIDYGENAARFVHNIRKKYEVVVCYLIGFNNEKNGIMNKTIFSDKIDNEWKYLENYIKLLEKIRNFKK